MTAQTFNPHVWGLFLQDFSIGDIPGIVYSFQSPCLGTLFASLNNIIAAKKTINLSIPMSGDSFCKGKEHAVWGRSWEAFNPHVWGLFLQEDILRFYKNKQITRFQSPCLGTLFARGVKIIVLWQLTTLSIPMSGDSFCKTMCSSEIGVNASSFQSPCLGTLFASA